MVVRRPIVRVHGRLQQLPPGDSLVGASPPAYPVHTHLVGINASGALPEREAATIGSQEWNIISGRIGGGGWVESIDAAGAWVDVMLPVGVVIGDSIAEGHPGLHGRLHGDGVPGFVENYPNQPGQLSYELSRLTGVHWYNHGIGSETSTQILARFDRDVLARTSEVGDGRGSMTLSRIPMVVVVVAGNNDIPTIPEETTKSNLLAMLDKAVAAKIIPIFLGISATPQWTPDQAAKVARINTWMKQTFPDFGAKVFDLWAWGSDGSGGVKSDRYVDSIHPTKAGYAQLALDVLKSVNLPLCMTSFRFDSKVDPDQPPSGFSVPTNISVTVGSVSVTPTTHTDWFSVGTTPFDWTQSPLARIAVGRRVGGRTGINDGRALFGHVCSAAASAQPASSSGMKCVALIYKEGGVWKISETSKGAYSIETVGIALKIKVDPFVTALTGWVGTAPATNTLRVSARWGALPQSAVEVVFGDGVNVLDPATSGVPDGVYFTLVTVG